MGGVHHSIEDKVDFTKLMGEHDTLGFCYPVYCSRVPRIMRAFVAKHHAAIKDKKLVILCTQMGFSGDGARAFMDIAPLDTAKVLYAEHFTMPNNVPNVAVTPLASEKTVQKYINKADSKLDKLCQNIQNGKIRRRGFNPLSRLLGLPQGLLFPAIERKYQNSVRVGEACNRCGVCVAACPTQNLYEQDGKITARGHCTLCYRCVNLCPNKCITTMSRGAVKRQYRRFI
jgi:ferredoxin